MPYNVYAYITPARDILDARVSSLSSTSAQSFIIRPHLIQQPTGAFFHVWGDSQAEILQLYITERPATAFMKYNDNITERPQCKQSLTPSLPTY